MYHAIILILLYLSARLPAGLPARLSKYLTSICILKRYILNPGLILFQHVVTSEGVAINKLPYFQLRGSDINLVYNLYSDDRRN